MPFAQEFRDVYLLGIRAAAEALNLQISRVDEQIFHKESILQRIYKHIEAADIIIAEMTGQNANVFYEIGYAHAKNKNCILITSKADDIPFDLRHHRHIIYESSIATLKQRLIEDIKHLASEFNNARGSISIAIPYINGEYKRDKNFDKATIEFNVDVHNNSSVNSELVEAFYLYAVERHTLLQDGIVCPVTASDIEGYKWRYLLKSPVNSIPRNGWVQVKLLFDLGIIAFDDRRKDEYSWLFDVMIRIIGSTGTHNEQILEPVEITDEIPF